MIRNQTNNKFSPFFRTILASAIFCLAFSNSLGAWGQIPKTEYRVAINGTELYVKIVGSGTPLLILHGGPGLSHDYLEPQLTDLLGEQYKLIFFDQRASGRSMGAEDTTRLTISQFVEDIEALRQHLSLTKISVMGHSFGGLLSMYYALAYPNAVDRLVLLDTSPASWDPYFPMIGAAVSNRATEDEKKELDKIRSRRPNIDPATMERYFKIYFRPFFTDSHLTESLQLGVTAQWVSNYYTTYPLIMKDLGHHDLFDQLPSLPPTLLIHGEDSVIPVESAKAIAERIPDCKIEIIKGVGHFPFVEAPKAFADAVKAFVR
jgi:proline iminopeptidase